MSIGGTSQSYDFNPSIADLFLESFARCEVFPPAITRSHIVQARRSLNYLLVSWTNKPPALWAVDLQTINLQAGVASYPVDPSTMSVLDVYYTQVDAAGPGVNADRLMTPMGRSDYAEIPNKMLAGTPTRYWFQKLAGSAAQMTIWAPPLATEVAPNFLVSFYRLRRLQDASPTMGQQPDVHYRALDVLAAELAVRLSIKYKPEKYQLLKAEAKEAWDLFATTDQEDSPISVLPVMRGYWP
jgi:hypothetical protein